MRSCLSAFALALAVASPIAAQSTRAPLPDVTPIVRPAPVIPAPHAIQPLPATQLPPPSSQAQQPVVAGERTFSQALLSLCFDPAARNRDPDLKKNCADLEAAAFRHARAAFDYDQSIFDWQLKSTVVLFWVVMALVISGVAFAALQFVRAMRAPVPVAKEETAMAAAAGVAAPGTSTTSLGGDLEISAKGVKASSSVLGVIVLVISMAFLYLYLTISYPITPVAK